MKISTLKIKFTQKIFILFIIASFLPLLLGVLFSYNHVVTIINDDAIHDLKKEAKQYGLSVFFRLRIAKDALEKNSDSLLIEKNIPLSQNHLSNYFSAVSIKRTDSDAKIIWGEVDSKVYSTTIIEHSNVDIIQHSKKTSDIYIILKDGIYGKVNKDFLWDVSNQNNNINFCIKSSSLINLFCNFHIDNSYLKKAMNSSPVNKTSHFEWSFNEEKINSSYWNLFLDHEFNIDEWTVIASQKGDIKNNRITDFKFHLLLQVIFSFLLVVLLSSIAIRRNFGAINKLIEGTKSITSNNFDYTIETNSSDEFHELANSFNDMSKSLKKVVEEYNAFSEIDKSILSSQDPSKIVKAIFDSLYAIAPFRSLLLINNMKNIETLSSFYFQKSINSNITSDNTEDIVSINLDSHFPKIMKSDEIALKDINTRFPFIGKYFYIIPIIHESLCRAIIIGSLDDNIRNPYLETKIDSFSNKTSVAFQALHKESTLYYQANYDLLTNIPNRAGIIALFNQNADLIKKNDTASAFLYLDLDRFKFVNDNYGHTTGDKLLKIFSKQIETILAGKGKISRLGGDEFAIIINADNKESLLIEIRTICEKIITMSKQPFKIGINVLNIGTSIGVSLLPEHSYSFEETLRYSDIAMYFSKKKGGNCYSIYKPEMSEALHKKDFLERDLILALKDRQFEIYYQVKVDAVTHKPVGFEALFRWHHNTYGSIPTIDVINMAEEINVIDDLGRLVFELSVEQWQQWLSQGYQPGALAINVSPIQLTQPDFIDFVNSTIAKSPLVRNDMIEIEITESVMLEKKEDSLKALSKLQKLGFNIAIDDFGTGYSSLSYLLDIPANILKIDRAFILKIEQDENAIGFLSSLINLGKNMDYKIVVEGVETTKQVKILNECDVDQFQGYLFSKPLKARLIEGRFLSTL